MNKADTLFEKKMYQEALKEYEALYKSASGDTQLKALYRIAESKVLLFRYGEALQTIIEMKTPEDTVWKARFLILKAELFREYLKQYGWASRKDVVEGEKDITRKTPEEMHAEINAAYDELWNMREKLAEHPLSNEGYFVELR